MSKIRVNVETTIEARLKEVYAVVADYRAGHPAILPKGNFRDLVVEEGGYGAGTVIRFVSRVLGIERAFHQRVSEPEPGRVLVEQDIDGPLATRWTFTPLEGGQRVRVAIATETEASRGLQGLIERTLVPRALMAVYHKELCQLAAVVRQGQGGSSQDMQR